MLVHKCATRLSWSYWWTCSSRILCYRRRNFLNSADTWWSTWAREPSQSYGWSSCTRLVRSLSVIMLCMITQVFDLPHPSHRPLESKVPYNNTLLSIPNARSTSFLQLSWPCFVLHVRVTILSSQFLIRVGKNSNRGIWWNPTSEIQYIFLWKSNSHPHFSKKSWTSPKPVKQWHCLCPPLIVDHCG
jgi:sucrose-6-phosphate hydrolase SacC (GH32 family)